MLLCLLRLQLLNREHLDLTSQCLRHDKSETLQDNGLSDLRNVFQFIAHEAAHTFKAVIREMCSEHAVEFVDMSTCLDTPARSADCDDVGSIVNNVILVVNLSDNLF